MPIAVKRDATQLRQPRTVRSVPKADSVVELALLGSDGSAATRVNTETGEIVDEPGTQTNVQQPSFAGQMAPLRRSGQLGTREEIQAELNDIAFAVRSFPLKQPDQIMREVAAYTARLTELTVLLHRSEDYDRQYARVRTMQVQKWIEELDRQFKIASRLVEVARQDLAMLGGMT